MPYSAQKMYLTCGKEVVDEWAAFMVNHKEDVSRALAQEGVRHEAWFCGRDDEGLFLIGVMDTDDVVRSRQVSDASNLEVDRVHREFKKHWDRARRNALTVDAADVPAFEGCRLLFEAFAS